MSWSLRKDSYAKRWDVEDWGETWYLRDHLSHVALYIGQVIVVTQHNQKKTDEGTKSLPTPRQCGLDRMLIINQGQSWVANCSPQCKITLQVCLFLGLLSNFSDHRKIYLICVLVWNCALRDSFFPKGLGKATPRSVRLRSNTPHTPTKDTCARTEVHI